MRRAKEALISVTSPSEVSLVFLLSWSPSPQVLSELDPLRCP